ncbi:cupin domain-containing protein [Burkholderia sp. Ac-20365]|uniref:cupin domain-containing protein n=1 Tax=Burkholderia sp. Ac-20365 TaxID=2703897 RepID=UPI00197CA6AE|nr:cupin domain-containing protein [Burkholderia sp. Ac-20365]MBN3766177.1 cupin domain-containing protein [Burkholderia sp. Ac-20365]
MPRESRIAHDAEQSAGTRGPTIPKIGPAVKRLRQEKGLSLKELSERSGVSTGMLSRIERNLANPSLRVMTQIRHALGAAAGALFTDAPPQPAPVVRIVPSVGTSSFICKQDQRPQLDFGYMRKELLTPRSSVGMQMMILSIPPQGASGSEPFRYPAEKAGLMLEGEMILTVGDEKFMLEEGDSFLFDGSLAHTVSNPGDTPCKVLWIIGAVSGGQHI